MEEPSGAPNMQELLLRGGEGGQLEGREQQIPPTSKMELLADLLH